MLNSTACSVSKFDYKKINDGDSPPQSKYITLHGIGETRLPVSKKNKKIRKKRKYGCRPHRAVGTTVITTTTNLRVAGAQGVGVRGHEKKLHGRRKKV